MCNRLEGWMIGSDANQVTVGTVDTRFLGSNPNRLAIVFCPHIANRYTIKLFTAAILDSGITIFPGQIPFIMRHADFGCSLHEEIRCIASAAGTVINYIELMVTPPATSDY
jgi:hypothetical protein